LYKSDSSVDEIQQNNFRKNMEKKNRESPGKYKDAKTALMFMAIKIKTME